MVEGHAAALPWRVLDGVSEGVLLGIVKGVGVEASAAITGSAAIATLGHCINGGSVGARETLPLLIISNHVLQLH